MAISIAEIIPTIFLKRVEGQLQRLAQVRLRNDGEPTRASLVVEGGRQRQTQQLDTVANGDSTHEVLLEEVETACRLVFVLRTVGGQADRREVAWQPARRWVVHVVQYSHHDVGYTDLASRVIPQHVRYLDEAINMAAATRHFPDEAQFRITVEQVWSIDEYLHRASPGRVAEMVRLIRSGHLEVTALFGNMTTELCGHETLARCFYDAARLKRKYGIPIITAAHNDIPGFAWGLCQALCAAGIKYLHGGLPNYHTWDRAGRPSFWDEQKVFGYGGMSGAFWWEAPSGQRVLFWYSEQGAQGEFRVSLPGLAERLAQLEKQGYPYDLVHWQVLSGQSDNCPYTEDYAHTIQRWNKQWEYPRLISSTNARFYKDFISARMPNLPVWRGDVPGQDYPVGATSTAAATALNRRNHTDLPAAEAWATVAGMVTDLMYPREDVDAAYTDCLWYDEHTWGFRFPCGPAAEAAEMEKAVHAHRAAALGHDVVSKAMARIADSVRLEQDGIHMVVFNPLPRARTDWVAVSLWEIESCGGEMALTPPAEDPLGCGYLRLAFTDRWNTNPSREIVDGQFDLVDVETGTAVPYQIVAVDSPLGPVPHAAQRLGLGSGSDRLGCFQTPLGLKRDLRFCAVNVPALGYRAYRLTPRAERPVFPPAVAATDTTLENEFYRLEVDRKTGFLVSLLDKQLKRELVDPQATHPFGALVVRDPTKGETIPCCRGVSCSLNGPLVACLRVLHAVQGHPHIEQTFTLLAGLKRIEWSIHVLKDPTPLLEAALAFSFAMPGARWRYEGPMNVHEAGRDLLPGAYSSRLTMQNWAAATGTEGSVLWSSLDAPVMSVGSFWPSRISSAHACVRPPRELERSPQSAQELRGGTVYSCLFANNFTTNFAVAQSGALFRHVITSVGGTITDAEAVNFGQAATTSLRGIFTRHAGPRPLPPQAEFLHIDSPSIQLLTLKQAEDARGIILRLWNPGGQSIQTRVAMPRLAIHEVRVANLTEEDGAQDCEHLAHEFVVEIAARSVLTIRVIGETAKAAQR